VTAQGEAGTGGICGSISGVTHPMPASARTSSREGPSSARPWVNRPAEQLPCSSARVERGLRDVVASSQKTHAAATRPRRPSGAGSLIGFAHAGPPAGASAVTAREMGGTARWSALASRLAREVHHGGTSSFESLLGDRTGRRARRRLPVRSGGLAALVLAAGLALAACGYSGSGAAKVRSWVAQSSFVANERQVLADVRSLELAVAHGSALQLRTVCGGLSSDAGTLYETLPTPDHTLTDELGGSMETLFPAATSCAVASSTRSARVTRDLATIERAMRALARARQRLAADGVRSPQVPPVTLPK
jgi:hypothetical protein